MNRKTAFALLAGLVLLAAPALLASAADVPAKAPAVTQAVASIDAAQPVLSADPYLGSAEVTTSVVEAHYCTCTIIAGCSYQPQGFDCADPPGCCHCAGSSPALRTCVGN